MVFRLPSQRPLVLDSWSRELWQHDVLGDSYCTVAGDLGIVHNEGLYAYGEPRAPGKTTVRYRVVEARKRAHGAGVLPWAAWPEGKIPADWWLRDRFVDALTCWCGEEAARLAQRPALLAREAARAALAA